MMEENCEIGMQSKHLFLLTKGTETCLPSLVPTPAAFCVPELKCFKAGNKFSAFGLQKQSCTESFLVKKIIFNLNILYSLTLHSGSALYCTLDNKDLEDLF